MAYTERYICNYEWDTYDEKTKKKTHHKCTNAADDARKLLDIDTIVSTCESIADYTDNLKSIDKMVEVYTSNITKTDLSVDGTGIENLATDCHGKANNQISSIKGHVNGVKSNAISAFNALQGRLNDIAKAKCSQTHGK